MNIIFFNDVIAKLIILIHINEIINYLYCYIEFILI